MAVYFLDTSALVKRYIAEVGSNWVLNLCHQEANNTLVISRRAQSQKYGYEARAEDNEKVRDLNRVQRPDLQKALSRSMASALGLHQKSEGPFSRRLMTRRIALSMAPLPIGRFLPAMVA